MAEIFDFEDDDTVQDPVNLKHLSNGGFGAQNSTAHVSFKVDFAPRSDIDELCDTVADLNTDGTRPISINTSRRLSSSFQPGSADGRFGQSLEIGIKSPFVSSFAESMNRSGSTEDKIETSILTETPEPPSTEELDHHRKMKPSDFQQLKVLGQGTYGKVMLVREKRTNRLFAQKQLKKASMVVEKKHVVQTMTERDILESVRHPYIVRLFYAMQDREKLYLILEYAQGGELFTYLANQVMLSEDTVAFYMAEMVLALHHLHVNVGVVYRDLKPENCLLDSEGHLVLTDFGLSKVATDDDASCRTILGTPEYMAPEILQGQEYDYAVDWWSLGAVAYDLLTGNPPFPGNDYKSILQKIWRTKRVDFPFYLTRDAQNLISRFLNKDPKARMGYKDIDFIKKHSFFCSIDWEKLERRDASLVPPIIPMITDPELAENFSKEFTDMPLSPPSHDSPLAIPVPSSRNSRDNLVDGLDLSDMTGASGKEENQPFKGFSFTASKSFIDGVF